VGPRHSGTARQFRVTHAHGVNLHIHCSSVDDSTADAMNSVLRQVARHINHDHGRPDEHARCVTAADLSLMEQRLMFTLQQTLEEIRATRTVIDGLDVLLDNLRTNVAEILSGARVAPATQALIDQAFNETIANKTKLAEVVLENTPVEPPAP